MIVVSQLLGDLIGEVNTLLKDNTYLAFRNSLDYLADTFVEACVECHQGFYLMSFGVTTVFNK